MHSSSKNIERNLQINLIFDPKSLQFSSVFKISERFNTYWEYKMLFGKEKARELIFASSTWLLLLLRGL